MTHAEAAWIFRHPHVASLLPSSPIVSFTMAPIRKKYNWSHKITCNDDTLPALREHIQTTGPQKSHELHCVRRKGKERQRVQSGMEYRACSRTMYVICQFFRSSSIFTLICNILSQRAIQQQMQQHVIIHVPQTWKLVPQGPSTIATLLVKFSLLFLLLVS
jgi:hypothetical protein